MRCRGILFVFCLVPFLALRAQQSNSSRATRMRVTDESPKPTARETPVPAPAVPTAAPPAPASYLLVFDWMPSVCGANDQTPKCSSPWGHGFEFDGLWAFGADNKLLSNCASIPGPEDPSTFSSLVPSPGSLFEIWRDRGACSGLAPEEYYTLAQRLTNAYAPGRPPEAFRSPTDQSTTTADSLKSAMASVGQDQSVIPKAQPSFYRVECDGTKLKSVALCLDGKGQPESCSLPAPDSCSASIEVPANADLTKFDVYSATAKIVRQYSLTSAGELTYTDIDVDISKFADQFKSELQFFAKTSTTSLEVGTRFPGLPVFLENPKLPKIPSGHTKNTPPGTSGQTKSAPTTPASPTTTSTAIQERVEQGFSQDIRIRPLDTPFRQVLLAKTPDGPTNPTTPDMRAIVLSLPEQGGNAGSAPREAIVAVVTGKLDPQFPSIQINSKLLREKHLKLVVDGRPVETGETLRLRKQSGVHHFELFPEPDPWDCLEYPDPNQMPLSFDLQSEEDHLFALNQHLVRNGIVLKDSKIIDTYWLQSKLAVIQSQLSGLNLWSASAITGQFGNLQGQQATNSYVALQAGTAPTPQISNSTINGYGSTQSPSQISVVQAQCSPGTVPTLGSGSTISCVVPSTSGTAPTTSTTLTTTTNQATAPSTQTTNQLTQASFTPSAPTLPTVTGPTVPTNVGVSGTDVLSEQVQLNSQLTIYEALLSGAQSDNYFVQEDGRVSGVRRQTTLAFPISVEPYPAYKDAVAEVRIIVVPRISGQDNQLSLVNLLPAAKTYNVAKVATNTKQFGAGVAIQAIGLSGVAGKSKTQLYLVKDTDTVALEYPSPGTLGDRDAHGRLSDAFRYTVPLGGCVAEGKALSNGSSSEFTWDSIKSEIRDTHDPDHALIFGWQFRPVLGADYVQAGQRTVFAQIALNSSTPEDAPLVFVETRWRSYDRERQVAGPVFANSCTWKLLEDAVAASSPVKVKSVRVEDIGDGTLKVAAMGDLTDPALTVRYGNKHITPDVPPSDGFRLEFYQPAKDLIQPTEINIVSESDVLTPLENPVLKGRSCSLRSASMTALSLPDSTSIATLHTEFGSEWMQSRVGKPLPLLLIGSDVYGLHSSPYLNDGGACTRRASDNALVCDYQFHAQTSALRAAGVFTVKNLGWPHSRLQAPISFAPTFSSIKAMTTPDSSTEKPKECAKDDKKCLAAVPAEPPPPPAANAWYELTGTDFHTIAVPDAPKPGGAKPACTQYPCLEFIEAGGADAAVVADKSNFLIRSDTEAFVQLPPGTNKGPLRAVWVESPSDQRENTEWDVAFDKGDSKKTTITADPAQLHKGDSRTVTFTGTAFCNVNSVVFEKTTLTSTPKDSKTLQVLVTSDVTKKTGHKELQASTTCGQVVLAFDVITP